MHCYAGLDDNKTKISNLIQNDFLFWVQLLLF